jgi:polysaccharide biosynthesis protein PslJ
MLGRYVERGTYPSALSSTRGPDLTGSPHVLRLPIGWPLLAVVGGYPVAWLLGVKLFAWPLLAVLLGVWLLGHRGSLRAPAGIGLWLSFIAWTVVSAFMLDGSGRLLSWGYREGLYVTATIVVLFLLNVAPRELPTRRITAAVVWLFAASVVLGMLGILFPDVALPTVAERVLPGSLTSIEFVSDQVQARLGGTAEFIGAVRPAAPYGYTNEWGAAMGVLLPLSIYGAHLVRRTWVRRLVWTLLGFSLVPIVISVNRGLWASVIVALVVVTVRAALARRFALLGGVGAAAVVAALLIAVTPLHEVIAHRLDRPNLSTRETLISGAIDLAQGSPLFGYGAPVESALADSNDVSVGTHGQVWTLLVSQGIPGATLYIAFFVVMLALTWKLQGWALWPWAAIVVSLAQMPFYNALPVPLVLAMIAVALCWRENEALRSAAVPHLDRAEPTGQQVRVASGALEGTRS